VRRRAEFYYQQLAAPRTVRQQVRRELLAEAKKHPAWKRLCQIPAIGPIRTAVLLGILQTPHRFRTQRLLWTYSGLGIETQSSADHRRVDGQLERAKKQISIRGLNRNCNHDLKNLFKGAAIVAASKPGPFAEFYAGLLAKGLRPEMARLTLARKIATIVLIVWKKGVSFDAQYLKPQTAWVSRSASAPSLGISLAVACRFSGHSGSRASLSWLVRRCVPRAPSLPRDPRPFRTTRKSYGPRVPDRTMVAQWTTVLLCCFRN
jgi:hypothetical protein